MYLLYDFCVEEEIDDLEGLELEQIQRFEKIVEQKVVNVKNSMQIIDNSRKILFLTALLMPEGTEVVKQLILAAWAGGESVADLRTLLAGQRVPAIKTSENWSVSLAELPLILSSDKRAEVKETEKGLSYKDYLRILLFLKDTKEVTMRLADRIEENIRSLPEKEYFRIDQCVTKLEIENKVTVYGDISYTFPAYFGYQ